MWSNVISPTGSAEFTPQQTDSEGGEKQPPPADPPPPTRYKHSATLHSTATEHFIYVNGGRSGTFALKDFWELNLNTGKWREIKPPPNASPDTSWPPRLQEHTLVSANNRLYMFGGECHHNSDTSSHVWVWSREHEAEGWEKIRFKQDNNDYGSGSSSQKGGLFKRSQLTPVMRRGHSAVVCEVEGIGVAIVVFGGYRDLKGSLGDCWAYGVATNTWHLLSTFTQSSQKSSSSAPGSFWTNILSYWTSGSSSSTSTSTSYTNLIQTNGYYKHHGDPSNPSGGPHPQTRHNHSAVQYNSKMYVYGGMCDLVELSDFWVFELESRRWSQIKCLYSPGVLKGAASTVVGGYMYLFGGEGKGGVRVDDVWRFDFVGETFERLQFPGCHPCPRVFATATKLPRRKPQRQQQQQQKQAQQRLRQEQDSLSRPQPPTTFVKKSTSTVRFADTQHLVTYSNGTPCSSSTTSPTSATALNNTNNTPSCSDYSSMETINYVENPNYNKMESFEMRTMGGGGGNGVDLPGPGKYSAEVIPKRSISLQHPEYVVVVGGLETLKSAVFSKKDLVVWRLRVDCFCRGDDEEDEESSTGYNYNYYGGGGGGGNGGGNYGEDGNNGRLAPTGGFSRERSFEVEF